MEYLGYKAENIVRKSLLARGSYTVIKNEKGKIVDSNFLGGEEDFKDFVLTNKYKLYCDILDSRFSDIFTINPRSLSLATRNSLKKFVEMVADNPTHSFNPYNFAMSEIQRSPKKNKKWHVIDIDSKDVDVKLILAQYLGNTPYKILETRGGFHCLIDLHNIDESIKKSWYNSLKNSFGDDLDQGGDIMTPIPGTYQGGWTPKFI